MVNLSSIVIVDEVDESKFDKIIFTLLLSNVLTHNVTGRTQVLIVLSTNNIFLYRCKNGIQAQSVHPKTIFHDYCDKRDTTFRDNFNRIINEIISPS